MRKLLLLMVAVCLTFRSLAFAQKYRPDPDIGTKFKSSTQPITLVARIGYSLKHRGTQRFEGGR